MAETFFAHLSRLRRQYGQKLLRFAGVSMVNVLTGQTLLVVCFGYFKWPGILANAVAVAAGSIPSYLLSRHFVWERNKGGHKVVSEIVPFWGLAFVGLVLSTIFVGIADNYSDHIFAMQAGNAAAFALLWMVRFAVLEHLLWGNKSDEELVGSSS